MTDCLSPSQLVEFQRCGEAWRRRHLEEDFVPPGIAAVTGRSVRETALACLRRRQQGETPGPEETADLAADAYRRGLARGVHLAPEELSCAAALLGKGRDNAVSLALLFRRALLPALSPLLVEEKVELDLALPLPVRVTLDCCTATGEVHAFSSASRRWNPERPTPRRARPSGLRRWTRRRAYAPRAWCSTCSSPPERPPCRGWKPRATQATLRRCCGSSAS